MRMKSDIHGKTLLKTELILSQRTKSKHERRTKAQGVKGRRCLYADIHCFLIPVDLTPSTGRYVGLSASNEISQANLFCLVQPLSSALGNCYNLRFIYAFYE